MGLLSHYIAYSVGKRRGGRRSPETFVDGEPDCIHHSACEEAGACLMPCCEFGERDYEPDAEEFYEGE